MFIPLDIFSSIRQNKGINNKLEAWLTFLGCDEVEVILKLIEKYPDFRQMYQQVYELCCNVEKVMGMFSRELKKLDDNTVQYMIDEMQDTIDKQGEQLSKQETTINEQEEQLSKQEEQLSKQEKQLSKQEKQLSEKTEQLVRKDTIIEEQLAELEALRKRVKELEK